MDPTLTKQENSAIKRDDVEATWAKVNFDRQIVAIAKASECSAIYSTDGHVKKHAAKMGIVCIHVAELPLPPDPIPDPQLKLAFEKTEQEKIPTALAPPAIPLGSSDGPSEGRGAVTGGEDDSKVNAVDASPTHQEPEESATKRTETGPPGSGGSALS